MGTHLLNVTGRTKIIHAKSGNTEVKIIGENSNNIYENELFPKNVEQDETEGYTEFDGINDDWEEFNERDFEKKAK